MSRGQVDDEILWLIFGVLILFGMIAAFNPTSTAGKVFFSIRKSFSSLFGQGTIYCPFINPYAMQVMSGEEVTILDESQESTDAFDVLCESFFDDCSSYSWEGDQPPGILIKSYEIGSKESKELCFCAVAWPGSVNNPPGLKSLDESTLENIDSCNDPSSNNNLAQQDILETSGSGSFTVSCLDSDQFSRAISREAQKVEGKSKVIVQLLSMKIPAWQCFIIYGLLPFLIIFYLLNDILTFAFFRSTTRKLLAVFGALIAVVTGAFAELVIAVAKFTNLAVGQTFLGLIFGLALISVLIGQIALTASVTTKTVEAVSTAVTAGLAMSYLAKTLAMGGKNRGEGRS